MCFKRLIKFYNLNKLKNTSFSKELLAGLTTFITLSYLFFLIPKILKDVGMPQEAVFTSIILASIFATLLMSLFAKKPFVLAPSFALTSYFVYSVVIGNGVYWQTALGALFIAGIIYLIISTSKLREILIESIPLILKKAIGAGIGLFLVLIGLKLSGLLVSNHKFFLLFGNLLTIKAMLTLVGVFLLIIFLSKEIKGAFLWTMFIVTTLSLLIGNTTFPSKFLIQPQLITPISLKLDILGAFNSPELVFSFLIILFFTTTTIVLSTSKKAKLSKNYNVKGMKKILLSDSLAGILGTLFGAPFVSTRAENMVGLKEGGKTGLTSLIVTILLVLLLFFSPMIQIIPTALVSAILIVTGMSMLSLLGKLKKKDISNNFPAYATIVLIHLTFSIPKGIALGFIIYVLFKLFSGKIKEMSTATKIMAIIFLIYLAL